MPTPTKKPKSDDAAKFAALHWYALTIEQKCIQLYVTDRTVFARLSEILTDTLSQLKNSTTALGAVRCQDGGCDEGYKCCENGLCAPVCDEDLDISAHWKKSLPKRKPRA